ncbi:DEAD/DEAH box helicase family protein [Candidatus Woesearchaeota archaeon]|nr:DEAD/DEAH box helicase family protein [Candidatus Woesearchaeota archaeon]
MEKQKKYANFQESCELKAREGTPAERAEARKYLKPGKVSLKLALDAERRKLERATTANDIALIERYGNNIEKAEEIGMRTGELELTYEGAERIYKKVKQMVKEAGVRSNTDYLGMFDVFDPITEQDFISTGMLCLVPEVREIVMNNASTLYRIALTANSRRSSGYALPTRHKSERSFEDMINSPIRTIYSSLPKPKDETEEEFQRKLKVLLDKKVERETFPLFRDAPKKAIETLDRKITETENEGLREAYQRLQGTYKGYLDFKLEGTNFNFRDPRTGERGVLPSLHQRSALYHLMKEQKLGIFDGCGTGKTAIATLAQPLIEKQTGKKPKVLVVVGTNQAKKAWKKGLVGDSSQRYLSEPQNVFVVNGERKDNRFMEEIEKADWVVMNKEQLIVKSNGGERLFYEDLRDMDFDYFICDEAHHIKSHRKTTKGGRPTLSIAAQELAKSARYVALLTASPIADRLNDYGVLASILQPERFPTPQSLAEKIRQNPRELYTFFHEKTVRRTSEEINEELDWEEREIPIEMTPVQEKIYRHLELEQPEQFLQQATKALLDPRLVDPEVLRRAGVLGEVGIESSAKYKRLEEILTSDKSPITRGEKFVIFTELREGVTEQEHEYLRKRYEEIGHPELYAQLQLNLTLDRIIERAIQKKFGKELKVRVLDGSITDIEEKERIVDRLTQDLAGLVCTTDTGGESLDFSSASYAAFLSEDCAPKTSEQALSRLLRKGQSKKVRIDYFRVPDSLDTKIRDYVEAKRIVIKIATDGHSLLEKELELLETSGRERLIEMVKKSVGGTSIDTYKAEVKELDDFETKKRVKKGKRSRSIITASDYETTDAQRVNQLIGQNPVSCWFNQEFVDFYMRTLPNLSPPVVHKARVIDLIKRAKERQVVFPKNVLAEASGPSMLYESYQELSHLIAQAGNSIPEVTDRDISALMLERGKNSRKILGNMNGDASAITDRSFDMVDNGSLLLLPSPIEIKKTLLESHRVLKEQGLLELVLKNTKFSDSFYSGLESLGFEIVSDKNTGFAVSRDFLRRLKETHGGHYAESYASKLEDTYMLLARKVDNPIDVDADAFSFEPLENNSGEEPESARDPSESRSIMIAKGRDYLKPRRRYPKKPQKVITPEREVTVDKWGTVIDVKKIGGEDG